MPSYTGRNVGEGGGGSGAPDTMSEGAHASEWSTDPVEIVRAVYPQIEDWVMRRKSRNRSKPRAVRGSTHL
jgi:hypothetical protein